MKIVSKNIAFYLRVSQEDMDNGISLKEESNSISNQRKLMENYIKRRKEFSNSCVIEYCDDGYTGTNFERQGFQRLMKDIQAGKIDTILLKDYSRLGRNYIQVGKYLEEIFPELEIRVISINDGYDSNNVIGTMEGINIPVKNLINEFYVKDLSKKVKSGIKTRQKQGQFISANAIFGYKKSAKDIHKLEIDDETAFIVEMIFDYALTGKNSIQIAKILNEQQIKTPAWYKNKSDRRSYEVDSKTIWTSAKVMKIIRDQRYAGDMVGNVRVTTKVAKNDNIRVDRKEWIIVENTHKGIVSKEIFRRVNEEIMPIKERSNVAIGESRRQGFCYCAYCGRLLQKENNPVNPYLFCVRQKYDVKNGCDEMKIMTIPLQVTLSAMVVKYVSSLIELQTFVKRSKMKIFQSHKSEMTGDEIDKEILKLKQSTIGLNQRYHEGRFAKEIYILQKDKIKMQIEELEKQKSKIVNGIGDMDEQKEWEQELEEKIERFKDRISFTENELAELIARVDVYSENEIRVKWRFMDFTAKATDYLVRAQKIAC